MMSHVHELNRITVSLNVECKSIGSYLLGYIDPEDEFIPLYPGRSDTNLRNRLYKHVSFGDFTHFRFFPTQRVRDAYHQECRDYHLLHRSGITNIIHPGHPKGLPYSCPYCPKGGVN